MRLAYTTIYDIFDRSTWFRTQTGNHTSAFYIARALRKEGVDIDYIGGLKKKFSLITPLKFRYYYYLKKEKYYSWAEPAIAKDYAAQIDRKLRRLKSDVVLCPQNAIPIAYLKCRQPVVLWTDSTLAGMFDSYPYLTGLSNETRKNILMIEKRAMEICRMIILSSEWAREAAVKTYSIERAKIKIIPRGANIEKSPSKEEVEKIIESRSRSTCKLVFIGVEWARKGGDTALEIAEKLNQAGLRTELNIIGVKAPAGLRLPPFVKDIGFIDRFNKEWEMFFNQMLAEAHFLVFPSRAEAFGLSICLANAFGVPALATSIGGIPSAVKDNLNGKLFSPDSGAKDYCDYILKVFNDYPRYRELAMSSFNEYQTRLNWGVIAKQVKGLLQELI